MTLGLLGLVARHWDRFVGWVGPTVDPWDLPAHRMLSLIYAWATDGADEEAIRKFDRKLWMPPKGVVPEEGPWTREAEMAAFRGLAGQLNIKTGVPTEGE